MIIYHDIESDELRCNDCGTEYWADPTTEEGTTQIIRIDGTRYLMPQCPKCKSLEYQTKQDDVLCLT